MSDDNIFNDGDKPIVEPTQTPSVPDHLKDMIGEGKKYATVELALASLPHAQAHIQRIEDENKRMRDELARANAAEEAYNKLMADLEKPPASTPPVVPGLDEASVARVFEQKMAERERNQVQAANVKRVLEGLKGKFGDKAEEVYKAKAEELGIGTGFLNDLIKHSPKAAEELFGIQPKSQTPGSTTGTVNTAMLGNRPHEPTPVKGPLSGGNLLDAWKRAKESIKE